MMDEEDRDIDLEFDGVVSGWKKVSDFYWLFIFS